MSSNAIQIVLYIHVKFEIQEKWNKTKKTMSAPKLVQRWALLGVVAQHARLTLA